MEQWETHARTKRPPARRHSILCSGCTRASVISTNFLRRLRRGSRARRAHGNPHTRPYVITKPPDDSGAYIPYRTVRTCVWRAARAVVPPADPCTPRREVDRPREQTGSGAAPTTRYSPRGPPHRNWPLGLVGFWLRTHTRLAACSWPAAAAAPPASCAEHTQFTRDWHGFTPRHRTPDVHKHTGCAALTHSSPFRMLRPTTAASRHLHPWRPPSARR